MISLKSILLESMEPTQSLYFIVGKKIPNKIVFIPSKEKAEKMIKDVNQLLDKKAFISVFHPNQDTLSWCNRFEKRGWSRDVAMKFFQSAYRFYTFKFKTNISSLPPKTAYPTKSALEKAIDRFKNIPTPYTG